MINRTAYQWPLAVPHLSLFEKLRVVSRFAFAERWTLDKNVCEFEKRMAEFVGCKYALFVSSGSTANSLLAMYVKDHLPDKKRTKVVFPAVTWPTSVSPWIREGFHPVFFDIHPANLSLNTGRLDRWLEENHETVACIFPTSLMGFSPDVSKLMEIEGKYNIPVMLDNCEATFSSFKGNNLSSLFTSTTSTYFGHNIQSIEGGFVFTNDEHLYVYANIARDHGLKRCLKVSPFPLKDRSLRLSQTPFQFYSLGSNFRNNELSALVGLFDLRKAESQRQLRLDQYKCFRSHVSRKYFRFPCGTHDSENVPFALPMITEMPKSRNFFMKLCNELGIETRPFVAGNLLKQPAFERFKAEYEVTTDVKKYDVSLAMLSESQKINNDAFYVGIGNCTSEKQIIELAKAINESGYGHGKTKN